MNMKNENKYKNTYKPLFFILIISLIFLVALVSLNLKESQKTVPKVKVSYFKDNGEFATSIEQRLHLELTQAKHIWIGIEPEKNNHLDFALRFKNEIEKTTGRFDKVILDKELGIPHEMASLFGPIQEFSVKENIGELIDVIQKNMDKKILVVTASIYSTNFLKQNPITKVKESLSYKPMTFSTGNFALSLDDEKNNLFKCDTEDKTGVGDWACAVINKARTMKRKVDLKKLQENPTMVLGAVDLTGESDYMVLIGVNLGQTAGK